MILIMKWHMFSLKLMKKNGENHILGDENCHIHSLLYDSVIPHIGIFSMNTTFSAILFQSSTMIMF